MAGYDVSLYRLYLAGVPMFARCTTAQLDLVAALGEADSYVPGQDIVREGDEGGGGFFVMTGGRARVRRHDHDVAELGTGDYFGELSLFDPAPRNATVTAIDTVSCVVLSADAFRRALDELPSVRDALLHGMARRIHELDERY
jgi:CRP-like cAMP-binding protein